MQNLNINKVRSYPHSHNCGIIKGIHCGSFVCLLIHQQDHTQNQSAYFIKLVTSNNEEKASLEIDIGKDIITSDLDYIALVNLAFVSTSTRIFLIDCKTPEVVSINIPVVNDDCVIATSWNSEHDSLAVAYQSGKVMVYCINYATYNLILLAEDNPEHKGEQSVYLGWGDVKKQFKGKAVASYLKESHPPESTYKHLSQDAFISWQVGERFFLVNSQLANERVIRIFDNECRLFYTITNMKVPGLCSKTAFRPKHNTLATVCKSDDSTSYIVMHERNGEYYNSIFPSSNGNVQDIQFSTCGRIFTILSYSKEKYFLDVYMQSNFIWLHKFRFTEETEKLMIAFRLNQTIEDTYSIEMIYYDCVAIYELVQVVTSVEDCHRVYVHIGNSLQEFDYKKSVIPPCGVIDSILNINEPINNVVAHENILILIDSQEVAHVYRKRDEKWQEDHSINLKLKSNNLPVTWTKYLLSVIDDTDCLMAIGFVNNTCMKRIVRLDGDKNNDHQEVTENVNYAYKTSNSNIINVISADAYRTSSIQSVFNFSELKVDCVLLQNGELYINQKCFAKGVTSVLNYNELYLLITITCYDDPMDRMYCITVERLLTQSLPPINEISWSRRIEKGTILICMADDDGSVILEMPRGNIELVTVRPIILRNVYRKIVEGKFYEMYNLIRRLAMKLDVLYDLAPDLFHQNVPVFVKSLGSTESVIKFLLPLKNKSTLTRTDFLFVNEYPVEDKRCKICDAIIEVCSKYKSDENDLDHYRIICIALFVKHNHDSYESLRFLVNQIGGIYTTKVLLQVADVINMLKMYGDPNAMYKQALALYDVELAATIAQLAGMDPQVYRRFLELCKKSSPISRRFLMANEGGSYKAAGYYLLILYRKREKNLADFMEYIKDKAVLDDVFKAMNKDDGDAMLRVSQLLCEKYIANGMYKEAAAVCCKAGLKLRAIELLVSGVCWKEAVHLIMYSRDLNNEEKRIWFEKLANVCMTSGKHREAAYIYLEQCYNVDQALNCYLSGHLFKEFIEIIEDSLLTAQINKNCYLCQLKDTLVENIENVKASVVGHSKMYELHFERLKVVRESRKDRADCALDGDDAYSEAGSVTTRSHSSYASTTTRRTRKLEMKLRSLRHGGKFEDIALMRELYDIIADVFNIAKDLSKLNTVYIKYAQIQTDVICDIVANLQQRMKQDACIIWIPEYAELEDDVLTADFITENIVHLGKELRTMPDIMKDSNSYILPKIVQHE